MNLNPPERVLSVINQFLKTLPAHYTASIEIWSEVLSGADSDTPQETITATSLTAKLTALTKQLETCEDLLKPKGVPPQLYKNQFTQLKEALSPTQAATNSKEIAKAFSKDVLIVLDWASWVIGSLEKPIAIKDLKELMISLNELDAIIAEPGLPDSLRALIQNNIREIREAIELYPIIGANGLKIAVSQFFGDAIQQQNTLNTAKNSPDQNTSAAYEKLVETFQNVIDAFNTSVTTADNVIKIGALTSILNIGISWRPQYVDELDMKKPAKGGSLRGVRCLLTNLAVNLLTNKTYGRNLPTSIVPLPVPLCKSPCPAFEATRMC